MAAEAAVSFAAQILGNLLVHKAFFLQGVERQVEWLKDELQTLQCSLKDAAEKQANNEMIRNWISEIREVAQDAEDAIEMFVLKVENTRRSRGLVGRCVCFAFHVCHLNSVGEEIESIRTRLDDIKRRREIYGIQNLSEGTTASTRRLEDVERWRRLSPREKDKHLVGLNEDVEKLLKEAILDEKRDGLSIAAIVGMGGIGKSTLAWKIYNDAALAHGFDRRAWVVVSIEFTPADVFEQIMLQLPISRDEMERLHVVQSMKDKLRREDMLREMLREQLDGKRYFMVLDDVWEPTHWESLRSAFPDEQDIASRLLFTSRQEITTRDRGYIHRMNLLGPSESWELLLRTVFNGKTDCLPELEKIGREILKKCGGLPLAITMAGRLLAEQGGSASGWEKVLKEIRNFNLGRSEMVSAVLELSYHCLPPELKACFLCLGFFKEVATISAKRLAHIWIALGLVPQEVEETMEETARGYLDALIVRNLVQVVDVSKDDGVRICRIHDLLGELSIRKAKEEISFEILRERGSSQPSHKPRHRAMYCNGGRFVDSTNQNKHLRSLFFHALGGIVEGRPSSYWKSFELLRVLDFEGCRLEKLPDAIGALIGLRYLGLRGTGLDTLPRSLGCLRNLQVLDVQGCSTVEVPNVIWKMDCLRHLYVDCISHSGGSHLKIETLKNIQTLKYIQLSDWMMVEHPTHDLTISLRKLGIEVNVDLEHANKLFTSLAMLEHLVSLNLKRCTFLDIDGLGTLHHITQLKLVDELFNFPSASTFPPNLLSLTLDNTWLFEDPMPVLEKLPKLLYLKLRFAYKNHEQMVISNDGLPTLKVLSLHLPDLRNMQVGKGAMPQLKQLKISKCPLLTIENLPEHLTRAVCNH